MRWWEKYIGIPFVHNACGFEGCDCGGLVLLVLREELGSSVGMDVTAPKFTREQKNAALYHYLKFFDKVDEPQEFDVFMLHNSGSWNHCGLFLPDGRIIHSCEGDQIRVEVNRLNKTHLQGYYRLKNEYRNVN